MRVPCFWNPLTAAVCLCAAHVNPRQPGAIAQVLAYQPAVALVERTGMDGAIALFILDLLYVRPGLPIIGLDTGHSVLMVLPGHQQPATQVADLVRLIEQVIGGSQSRQGLRQLEENDP